MKVVFIGGGSFRTLPILRAALADGKTLRDGEVQLVDFNLPRVETVARLVMRTPEFADSGCRIAWTDKLDEALPGADMVSVSFPVGSPGVIRRSDQACDDAGFLRSDQLSLSGAFRSVTGGTILLDIARQMEKHCPLAWLVDFANPVAVYSGMVNNHTRIRALGICGGFANHRWDLSRLLFDRDAYDDGFQVAVAGVNHLSLILRGTYHGEDLYAILDRRLRRKNWKPCRIRQWPPAPGKYMRYGLARLAEMYRRFGTIIFSTESDGMAHIFFDEMRRHPLFRPCTPATRAQVARDIRQAAATRAKADLDFRRHLDRPLDAAFWSMDARRNPWFAANPADATVPILKALAGTARPWLAASLPNRGAVRGFKDRTVLEYSMHLDRKGVHAELDLEVPDCFHGLISSLATHQTLLGDAIATRDPRIFAHALFAYPIDQNTRGAKALWRDLLRIHAREMPAEFQKAADYF